MGVPAVGVAGSGELPLRPCPALPLCCVACARSARNSGMICSNVGRSAGACAQQRLQVEAAGRDHMLSMPAARRGATRHASARHAGAQLARRFQAAWESATWRGGACAAPT